MAVVVDLSFEGPNNSTTIVDAAGLLTWAANGDAVIRTDYAQAGSSSLHPTERTVSTLRDGNIAADLGVLEELALGDGRTFDLNFYYRIPSTYLDYISSNASVLFLYEAFQSAGSGFLSFTVEAVDPAGNIGIAGKTVRFYGFDDTNGALFSLAHQVTFPLDEWVRIRARWDGTSAMLEVDEVATDPEASISGFPANFDTPGGVLPTLDGTWDERTIRIAGLGYVDTLTVDIEGAGPPPYVPPPPAFWTGFVNSHEIP